jgi:Flp pilus assembly protein TadG
MSTLASSTSSSLGRSGMFRPAAYRERGQSLVELAIFMPLLILILACIVDLGRGFYDYIIISNAVMQGARYGASYPGDTDGIRTRVTNETTGTNITLTSISISYPSGNSAGNPIRVAVSYQIYTILGSILGPSQLTLSRSVDAVIL